MGINLVPTEISNIYNPILAEVFFAIIGLVFIATGIKAFRDSATAKHITTGIFWTIMGVCFIVGQYIPSWIVGVLIVASAVITAIGGVVQTHSSWATSWAQAGRSIPCYGTTHADYFYGEIPCARVLTKEEVETAYEKNTGKVIIEAFEGKDPLAVPGVLCTSHGPFTWGKNAAEAVHNAVVLEEVAKMATRTEMLRPDVKPAVQYVQDKHYFRKHGANAYYGQK